MMDVRGMSRLRRKYGAYSIEIVRKVLMERQRGFLYADLSNS